MNKVISFIIISLFLASCRSLTAEYSVTSAVLKSIKKPFNDTALDSIDLVNESYVLQSTFFEDYEKAKDEFFKGASHSHKNFVWNDTKESWVLNDDDLNYMASKSEKTMKIRWQPSKFKLEHPHINIVPNPVFRDAIEEDKERMKRVKSECYIFNFSTPIFNQRKDIAVVSYYSPLIQGNGNILIFKRHGNVWSIVGSYK